MKNRSLLIILVSLISTCLYAATDFATNKEATLEYSKGLTSFNQKDYDTSFEVFSKLVDAYPGDEKVNFYYGRSAFELKKYEFALTAFDRILISNPTSDRVRLEYARTLYMMKSYKEAKKEFQAVLATPIPVNVRKNVEKFLEMIDQQEKSYILNKVAIFGFGWDNNINNNTYEAITLVNNLPLTNDTNKISDTNFKTILVGNLIVPNKSNNKLSWESTGIAYMQEQRHYHDNDIFLISLSSGVGYTNQKYKNLASLTYDHIWLGGDQTLYFYGISNSTKYNIYKKHLLNVDIKYKKKKMIKIEDTYKSSNIKELSLGYTIPLENKDIINISNTYTMERKEHGTRIDVSKDTKEYKLSYTKKLFEKYDVTLGYKITKDKYKDVSLALPQRVDDSKTISLRVLKKLAKTKSISTEFNNIDNDSTINSYTYKKKSVNLNYTLAF